MSDIGSCYSFTERGQLKICVRTISSSFSLSVDEQRVLLFILDCTVRWNKVWAAISEREFENGIFRRRRGTRVCVLRGTGLRDEAVQSATNGLLLLNAIGVEGINCQRFYRINEMWYAPDLMPVWELNDSDFIHRNID